MARRFLVIGLLCVISVVSGSRLRKGGGLSSSTALSTADLATQSLSDSTATGTAAVSASQALQDADNALSKTASTSTESVANGGGLSGMSEQDPAVASLHDFESKLDAELAQPLDSVPIASASSADAPASSDAAQLASMSAGAVASSVGLSVPAAAEPAAVSTPGASSTSTPMSSSTLAPGINAAVAAADKALADSGVQARFKAAGSSIDDADLVGAHSVVFDGDADTSSPGSGTGSGSAAAAPQAAATSSGSGSGSGSTAASSDEASSDTPSPTEHAAPHMAYVGAGDAALIGGHRFKAQHTTTSDENERLPPSFVLGASMVSKQHAGSGAHPDHPADHPSSAHRGDDHHTSDEQHTAGADDRRGDDRDTHSTAHTDNHDEHTNDHTNDHDDKGHVSSSRRGGDDKADAEGTSKRRSGDDHSERDSRSDSHVDHRDNDTPTDRRDSPHPADKDKDHTDTKDHAAATVHDEADHSDRDSHRHRSDRGDDRREGATEEQDEHRGSHNDKTGPSVAFMHGAAVSDHHSDHHDKEPEHDERRHNDAKPAPEDVTSSSSRVAFVHGQSATDGDQRSSARQKLMDAARAGVGGTAKSTADVSASPAAARVSAALSLLCVFAVAVLV